MKTIKIVNNELYNRCVIDAELDHFTGSEYDLMLELTEEGLQVLFPENWGERPARTNITGEFGQFDYKELGFEIV